MEWNGKGREGVRSTKERKKDREKREGGDLDGRERNKPKFAYFLSCKWMLASRSAIFFPCNKYYEVESFKVREERGDA